VSGTVHNENWAVWKDRRVRDLPKDVGRVKFPDGAATIVPESVQFTSLRPTGAKVLEQNYEFDLLSAGKLLDKYIDREISIVGRDGSLIEGTLLSADQANLVLASDGGIQLVPRGNNVKDIRFDKLPEGLLLRPTLVWKVRAKKAEEHLVKIAYTASRINWRVDYRAVASADEKTLDVAGWVTIDNRTGTTFEDAALKLMAGDLHLVQKQGGAGKMADMRPVHLDAALGAAIQEKSFAEYHLYTLQKPTTLANAQIKQIELLKVEKIPAKKTYLYRPDLGSRVATILEFENSKKTRPGLGIPLPAGPFRLYQRDADGQPEFIGRDGIGHIPKDEPVRLKLGMAFDLFADRVPMVTRRKAGRKWEEQDWKILVRNHKDQAIDVTIEEPLHHPERNWTVLNSSHEYRKKDFRTLEYKLQVAANGQAEVKYTVQYTW
ncbi:MAG: hypothetical protein H8E44_28945, partial [Planctomycetes bacterium]|nr:hypothetical protein [Planctomycetota bacterium]